jgi:hypothetical protein
MSFIKIHIISKIFSMIRNRGEVLKYDGFFYFNEPIKSGDKILDRVGSENPFAFEEDRIMPVSFYTLDGRVLMEIFKKLKYNDFHIWKKMEDGKDYKIRLKKKNV